MQQLLADRAAADLDLINNVWLPVEFARRLNGRLSVAKLTTLMATGMSRRVERTPKIWRETIWKHQKYLFHGPTLRRLYYRADKLVSGDPLLKEYCERQLSIMASRSANE